MAINDELLRSSLELVLSRQPDLTRRFYANLFADHPELAPLFDRARLPEQEKMLGEALISVVTS